VFNLGCHPSALTRAVAFLLGHRGPGPTLLERLMIKDRSAARDQIGRIVAWEAERIVVAHGDVLTEGGGVVVKDGDRCPQPGRIFTRSWPMHAPRPDRRANAPKGTAPPMGQAE